MPGPDRRAGHAHLAGQQPIDAEQRARQFGPARADETGESDDLAAPHAQVHGLVRVQEGACTGHVERGVARCGGGRREVVLEVAADHQPDHGAVVNVRAIELADHAAVAQHDDAVRTALDLAQAVRDEDDADAVGLQARR